MSSSPAPSDRHDDVAATASREVETIRRVLRGQWANPDARAKALDALKELERCESRLRRQVEFHRHYRERAIAAEQALGLYGEALSHV